MNCFFVGKAPKNINTFRTTNQKLKQFSKTQTEARKIMLSRFGRLEGIRNAYEEVLNGIRLDRVYDYYIARVSLEITEEQIREKENSIRSQELAIEDISRKISRLGEENRQKNEIIISLSAELSNDESYQVIHRLEEEVKKLEEQLKSDQQEKSRLLKSVRQAREQMNHLLEVKDVADCAKQYAAMLDHVEDCGDVASAIHLTEQLIRYKAQMFEKVQMKMAQVKVERMNLQAEQTEINQRMERLRQKKLPYDKSVMLLKQKILEQLDRLGRKGEPRILCELLEITDPAWQNAVEGYLNTQRFYVLVEPENFDVAASVYDRLRRENLVYGVGVINTAKLEEFDEAPQETLASVVTSKNLWARRYCNLILGKVHLCNKVEELKKHGTSITKECMRYQNRVIMAIRPEIFSTPFIGVRAFKIQLEQAEKELEKVTGKLTRLEEQLTKLEYVLAPLGNEADVDIKYRLPVLADIRSNEAALSKNREQIKRLKKDATYIEKQIRLEELKNEYTKIDSDIRKLSSESGSRETDIKNLKLKIIDDRLEAETFRTAMGRAAVQLGDEGASWAREYEKQVDEKSAVKFKENYERRKKANWTTKEQAEAEMVSRMQEYKVANDFGAPDSLLGYPQFEAEYEKLVQSELLAYEEKVYRAKTADEHEFKEQFLSKLQENIRQAQGEFKEVIEELFDKLTLDDEDSSRTLQEYTDYRTYMDYDIRISHEDGTYFLYSKVAEEKSGGETQTPFYITVAASFIQLYKNSIGGDSIGLVLFDEAFNNMDDERIAGVLEFLNHSNLQTVIAAPPDKIQYIGPSVEKTLLVLKGDSMSFVEDFTHETV